MTLHLPMEIRTVDVPQRLVSGIVAPYDETTYLVSDPGGERIKRHAFKRSITQRGKQIPLCVNHDHSTAVGMSREWNDTDSGLAATFHIRESVRGNEVLADIDEGYLASLSVGFLPVDSKRAMDGVMEVREARLYEVSLVLIGAYDGAKVLASRNAESVETLMQPFQNPPILPVPFVAPW